MAKVLSLGQCAADNYTLSQFLQRNFEVEIVPAHTFSEALRQLRAGDFALVLVNRLLDTNGASGVAFISQLKQDADLAPTPVMLVSNYADAQKQAVARGALPGFGKAELDNEEVIQRLRPLLAPQSTRERRAV